MRSSGISAKVVVPRMVANAASKVGRIFGRLAGNTKNVKSGTKGISNSYVGEPFPYPPPDKILMPGKNASIALASVATVRPPKITRPLAPPPLPPRPTGGKAPRPTLYARELSRIQSEAATDSKEAFAEALAMYKSNLPLKLEPFSKR